ncbi:hypothetical protein LUZ60_016942 [Juncus effusus]|nr:hypothetical protein LUZ60_016942 [Juncus effusus]
MKSNQEYQLEEQKRIIMEEGRTGKRLQKEEGESRWPPWLKPMLCTRFFMQCRKHVDPQCNLFCLDCINGGLCSSCVSSHHRGHHTIQIRRSSYHDVIKASEIHKILDISGVQTYTINRAHVVFLNKRPHTQFRPTKTAFNSCQVCQRGLLQNFQFCSLACKIAGTCDDKPGNRKPDLLSSDKPGNRKMDFVSDSERRDKMGNIKTDLLSDSESFNPLTPPQATVVSAGSAKRRKGVPQRSPFGSLITIA